MRVSVPCWPTRASSWNQISSGLSRAHAGIAAATASGKFFLNAAWTSGSDLGLASAVQRFLGHYTPNLSRRSYPYPHTVQTLTDLAADGWRLVVCTNKLEASARKLLSDHGLMRFFALVAGPDTFGVAKPDPAHLLHCLPGGGPAIMIGDSEPDILAAKAAHLTLSEENSL